MQGVQRCNASLLHLNGFVPLLLQVEAAESHIPEPLSPGIRLRIGKTVAIWYCSCIWGREAPPLSSLSMFSHGLEWRSHAANKRF